MTGGIWPGALPPVVAGPRRRALLRDGGAALGAAALGAAGAALPGTARPTRAQAPVPEGAAAAALPVVRVGTLRSGSLAWELDVVRAHGLEAAHGVRIEAAEFAAPQATQVALQGGRVDVVLLDWLWVARTRATGADWTCAPTSAAAGALVAPQGSPVRAVADLPGHRLGVAGTPLDKSWLILRAYARRAHGFDPDAAAAERAFGAAPLVAEQLAAGRLDAALLFWPFAARAEAAGMRRVLSVEDMQRALGVEGRAPVLGYVFSAAWAAREGAAALRGFLAASAAARRILVEQDTEWDRIAPLTGAGSSGELVRLRDWYRSGALLAPGHAEQQAASSLYALLGDIGGPALLGPAAPTLPDGTFWRG